MQGRQQREFPIGARVFREGFFDILPVETLQVHRTRPDIPVGYESLDQFRATVKDGHCQGIPASLGAAG